MSCNFRLRLSRKVDTSVNWPSWLTSPERRLWRPKEMSKLLVRVLVYWSKVGWVMERLFKEFTHWPIWNGIIAENLVTRFTSIDSTKLVDLSLILNTSTQFKRVWLNTGPSTTKETFEIFYLRKKKSRIWQICWESCLQFDMIYVHSRTSLVDPFLYGKLSKWST